MLIQIEDFENTLTFDNQIKKQREEFLTYISNQAKNPNSFWINTPPHQYPTLNVSINGSLATANFFDKREYSQSDWVSKSNLGHLDESGEANFFYTSATEEQ